MRRVITSQPEPRGDVGIDIDTLEAEAALDTSNTYYFGEDEAPAQRKCTEFCVVDMGAIENEEEPSVCTRAVRFMKEHPYQAAACAVGAGALMFGGGYLLHQALSGSSSNNDEPTSSNTADPAGAAEPQSLETAQVSSSHAADEALLGAVGGNGTETASAPSHEGAHARVARAAGDSKKELTRLSDDTIVYIKNKGWFTTHCRLECDKSGLDGKPIKYSSKYVAGGSWTAFHIPGGSENCVLSAPYLREKLVDSTLPSSQVNGNKLHEMHLWGASWGRQWSWQNPPKYASSAFPMFQKNLEECITHRSVYSCRGGFPRPRQFEITNQCLDTLDVTVRTEGKVKYSPYGLECSDYMGNDNPCIEGEARSGVYNFWSNLHGGESHMDYGCWNYKGVESVKLKEWKYSW